jgi:hypothetical protein
LINRLFSEAPGFRFAAFGYTSGADTDAAVWLSLDGSNLQREVVFAGPGDQRIQSVAHLAGLLVLVGYDASQGNLDAAIWTTELGE